MQQLGDPPSLPPSLPSVEDLREQLPCTRARHTPGTAARELPPQHKLVILSIHITVNSTELREQSIPFSLESYSLIRRIHAGQTSILRKKMASCNKTYGIAANMRARHIYNDPGKKISVKARLARKELITITIGA